ALGSAGDVHPLIGLGKALRARGHRVTVITNNSCEPVVRAERLDYVGLTKEAGWRGGIRTEDLRHWRGWQELLDRTVVRPALKTGLRRWRKLARSSTVLPYLRPVYRAIAERATVGGTVVVAGHSALGARIAQEKLGIPLATVH